ncbi:MAG: sensor histidine kinase [Bacteroidales bacterium]
MNQIKSGILIFTFLAVLLIPHKTNAQPNFKNVAVFFSFGSNLPAFDNILTGLKSTIKGKSDESVNIMTEYLDLTRSKNEDYARLIIDMYNEKLKEFKIDLLITVGPGVNDAILKYGDSTLKSLNIINIDLNIPGRTSLTDLNIKKGKEILLKFQVGETLKEAFNLFPENKIVYVISGTSQVDSYYNSLIRQNKNQFEPEHSFIFISDMSLDSIIRFVRTIPAKSLVIVPAYLRDATNITFSTPEALSLIAKNSPAPVFLTITDAGVKTQGGIGGYLFSYINLGKETGRIAREILNGKQIQDISVDETNFYEHIYDWNELERWNLTDSKAIPANSIFYNRDVTFVELYKWYIVGVLLFIITQTLLIIYLVKLNKRQKDITAKMQETENMHRHLIHTDRLSKMSTLTAALSHELYQPLAAIGITAQAGKRFINKGNLDLNKALQMFDNILEDNIRATEIISSVKSLMKPESSVTADVNLNEIILETVGLISNDAKKQHINIDLKLSMEPVFIFGDKIQIQQVLMNFIRNAISAMEKSETDKRILEIRLELTKEIATVSVRDSGPGIDTAIKERLFKPFVTTKKGGFGIGLTLCRTIIEKHKGKIWVENMPEGGAKFSFSLQSIKHG